MTTRCEQSAVYDDVGHVDWCGTKFDIQVQCLLNAAYLSTIAPTLASSVGNAADLMKLIRTKLMQPRKELTFSFDGYTLNPAKAGVQGTVDIRNGPFPQSCNVTQLTNDTFIVVYHITATYWENYFTTGGTLLDTSTNRPGAPVVFNRWSETVDIDNCCFSTRTREGQYMIRSDNREGAEADAYRSLAILSIPQGFLRQSSHYTVSPDGLGIRYRIVDKEQFKMPPVPAFEATGEFAMTTTKHGAMRWAEGYIRLKGAKTTPQADLVTAAVGIVTQKLRIMGSLPNIGRSSTKLAGLEYAKIRVGAYENWVEFSAKARVTALSARIAGWDSLWGDLVFLPGSDEAAGIGVPGLPPITNVGGASDGPDYLDYGTAGLLLQAAAYYDPSIGASLGLGHLWNPEAVAKVTTRTGDTQNVPGRPIGTAGLIPEA